MKRMQHHRLLALGTLLLGALSPLCSQAQSAPHSLSGNFGLFSDYRFRGISQTWLAPALQGGLDYAHASGAYAGVWGSNVSGNSYNNGAGLELDVYGGYKFALSQSLTLDFGALAYVYPGARLNSAPAQPSNQKYDNLDVYLGLSAGGFTGKLSVAASDYFGLNSRTAPYAYFSGLAARGSSKGSSYLDLNYRWELASLSEGLALDAHVGRLTVRRYAELSYTDFKLGVVKSLGGFNLGLAVVGSNADKAYYQIGNAAGQDAKRVGRTGLVLSLQRSF
ncbi:TorF family putative porin [Roseateles sp. BYS180W]|uniref:TorF family putative porin n=1 Tax=Roseateles rivi TaxID=3299028 RepID=A0ABW7FXJ1_9BURK